MNDDDYREHILGIVRGDTEVNHWKYDTALEVAAARGWVQPGDYEFRRQVPGGSEAYQRRLRRIRLDAVREHKERNPDCEYCRTNGTEG